MTWQGAPIESPPPLPNTTWSGTQKKGSPPISTDVPLNLTKSGQEPPTRSPRDPVPVWAARFKPVFHRSRLGAFDPSLRIPAAQTQTNHRVFKSPDHRVP